MCAGVRLDGSIEDFSSDPDGKIYFSLRAGNLLKNDGGYFDARIGRKFLPCPFLHDTLRSMN